MKRYITKKSGKVLSYGQRYNVLDTNTGMVVFVFEGYRARRDAWSRCRKLNNAELACTAKGRGLLAREAYNKALISRIGEAQAKYNDPSTQESLRYLLAKRLS